MNRRQFLGGAGAALALAGVAGAGTAPHSGPVRFGLIGCGGRGVYDAAGLVAQAGAQVVALADLFEDKLGPAKARLDEVLKQKGMPPIAPDRLYRGWQSGPRLAQGDVDAVLLALPAYFYPDMLEAVAETGKHIYCEKPVGVDVPGCLRVIEVAKKLEGKVVFHVGMQVPWSSAMREMARRIHSGAIGDIVTGQSFFYFGSIGHQPPPGAGPDEARIRKWVCDRVLSGDIVVEQNVHGIDKVNWILKGHPVSAFAKASRKARKDFGDIRDNFVGEMTYPDGIVVNFQSTQFIKGYSDAGERFYGTKGVSESHYSGGVKIYGEEPWDAGVDDIIADAETNKYRAFVDDIRAGNLRNEGLRGAESTLSAILVRTAADRGREVTWDEMLASGEKLESGIDLKQFG